ncbi:MAG TPA: hypothetical protein VNN76_00300 [Bacteroidota bacterium]|nr:hypothetical protein [Bacteroidota bacterium]
MSVPIKRSLRVPFTAFLLSVVFSTAVFSNLYVLSLGFIGDDYLILSDVQKRGVVWFGGWLENSGLYRPLVILSFWMNLWFSGTNPFGYHLTNLILHGLNGGILFLLLLRISKHFGLQDDEKSAWGGRIISFLLAVAFLFHPANVHNVAWISGRTDLLCAFFFFLSLLFFERYLTEGKHIDKYVSLGFFACSLASKETAVTLPLIAGGMMVGIELFGRNSGKPIARIIYDSAKRTIGYFVLLFVYAGFRLVVIDVKEPTLDWSTVGLRDLLVLAAKPFFLILTPFSPMDAYALLQGESPHLTLLTILLVCFLALLIVRLDSWKTMQGILFAACMIFLSTLPFYATGIQTQRLMYLPIGIAILAIVPVVLMIWKAIRIVLFAACILLCGYVFLHATFWQQNSEGWKQASALEADLVEQITSRLDNHETPILVLTYPQRVDQVLIFWALPFRLHYAVHKSFGRMENVTTGIFVVGSDFETLGKKVWYDLTGIDSSVVTLGTSHPYEHLMVDQKGKDLHEGLPIFLYEGQMVSNETLEATIRRLGGTTRPQEWEVRIKDQALFHNAQVFIFQDGEMKRIR